MSAFCLLTVLLDFHKGVIPSAYLDLSNSVVSSHHLKQKISLIKVEVWEVLHFYIFIRHRSLMLSKPVTSRLALKGILENVVDHFYDVLHHKRFNVHSL